MRTAAKVEAPQPSEHQSQCAVIEWWSYARKKYGLPEFALFAVPNAGAGASKGQAGKMKGEGTRAGIPDMMLAMPKYYSRYVGGRLGGELANSINVMQSAGLFIEMKKHPRKPSTEQQAVMAYLRKSGYEVALCYSTDEAIEAIESYLK